MIIDFYKKDFDKIIDNHKYKNNNERKFVKKCVYNMIYELSNEIYSNTSIIKVLILALPKYIKTCKKMYKKN